MSAQFPSAVSSARITDGTILDADVSDSAAIAPHKLVDGRAYVTVEELFFVTQPFSLTAGLAAELEVLVGTIPIHGRVDSVMFAPSVANPSITTSNFWRFKYRRKRVSFSGASSTKAVTSTEFTNTSYTKPWLQYEGVSLDAAAFSSTFAISNGAFFIPRDVMTIDILAVGTPVENCAGIFTVRIVPT